MSNEYDPAYLLSSSLDGIRYRVFPFEQGKEIPLGVITRLDLIPLDQVGDTNLENCLSEKSISQLCKELKCEEHEIEIGSNFRGNSINLLIGEIGLYTRHVKGRDAIGVFYFVTQNKEILSGLIDPSFHLQLGDGYTNAFSSVLKETTQISIENIGDVSSVVLITIPNSIL